MPFKLRNEDDESMNFGKIVFFCFIFTAGISFLWSEGITWEKIKTGKGVTVYKANVQGRVAFRGVGKYQVIPKSLFQSLKIPKGGKIGSKILNLEN